MTLYEIQNELMSLVDPETGEILDIEAFDQLGMAKEEKIEKVALWIKDLKADVDAFKNEMEVMQARKKSSERKIESLTNYLSFWLDGQKFQTPKCAVSFRSSKATLIPDESAFVKWAIDNAADLLTFKDPVPNKTAIKQAVEDGRDIQYAKVEEHKNIQIK